MAKLLPCPFCGCEVELIDYTNRVYGFWDYKIKCKKCRAYMDSPSTAIVSGFTEGAFKQTRNEETNQKAMHELIIIWNTRASKKGRAK